MPTEHIVQLLLAERDRIDGAIRLLQQGTSAKRRGRPAGSKNAPKNAPDWVTGKKPAETKPKRKRIISAKQRADQSRRMKIYWRNKRKASAATA